MLVVCVLNECVSVNFVIQFIFKIWGVQKAVDMLKFSKD